MEKKKRDCFPVRGGFFGKTAALPTAASLQRALECSPLLSLSSSISPNKLLPLVLGSISPASPRPPPSHHSAAELWSGLRSGSWEMFSQGALNPPTHTSSKQSAPGSLTFQHFLHVFIICKDTTWLPSSGKVKECVCQWRGVFSSHILTAHARQIFLIFERVFLNSHFFTFKSLTAEMRAYSDYLWNT